MKPLVALVALIAVAGCVHRPADRTVSSGVQIEETQLAQLKKGETTYADAVRTFGQPTTVSAMSDGRRTASYVFTTSHISALTGMEMHSTQVMLTFDPKGTLESYTSSQSQLGPATVSVGR